MGKLGLGTVQLGIPYGVANKNGKPDCHTAFAILLRAVQAGITCFDTASSYGDSEEVIGEFFSRYSYNSYQVSTKISAFRANNRSLVARQIQEELETSLTRLGGKIDYLLFHRASDLIIYGDIAQAVLEPYLNGKMILKTGVSVYTPEEAVAVLQAYPIEVIQIPINILDHRFLAPNIQDQFARHSIEIHARSVYLQGLLCMEKQDIPSGLDYVLPYIQQYSSLCRKYQLLPEQAAFTYVRDLDFVDRFFVGCETLEQLEKNIECLYVPPLPEAMRVEIDRLFADVPQKIVNPFMWRP